jgi:hypothetical protein
LRLREPSCKFSSLDAKTNLANVLPVTCARFCKSLVLFRARRATACGLRYLRCLYRFNASPSGVWGGGARVGVRSFKRVEPFCRVFFFFGGGGEFSESGGEFQLYAIPIVCAAFAPIQKVLWHHPACTSNISCLSHPQSSEHRISRGAKTFREACWSSAANQRRSKQTARLVNIAWKLSVVHTSGY